MSFKVGDILNGARIDIFEPGTILKQLEGTNSFNEDEILWIVTDNDSLIDLRYGFN